MKNIFIGFIFVFLDLTLTANEIKIGLIPDFLGYFIMISGLNEMGKKSLLFKKVKPYAIGMAVYSICLYAMDLIGASVSLGVLPYVLGFASTIVSLYISYNIVMGVKEIEGKYNRPLNGNRLKSTWTILAVFDGLTYATLLNPGIAFICVLISFIAAVFFLIDFNRSKTLYYITIK